jgi:NAD(P)H-quinone oxidoreductase subunit 6
MSMISLPEGEGLSLTWLLDIGIILGALGVVFLRKIIYSALLLGLVFVCVALWYLLLNADFLAAAQVLIYVGAVNVLIVFAIMLVNKPESPAVQKRQTGDFLSGGVFLGLFAFLINMILTTKWINDQQVPIVNQPDFNSIDIIGVHILTDLLLPFELLSILLLLALAGAITIARKEGSVLVEKNQTEIDFNTRSLDSTK